MDAKQLILLGPPGADVEKQATTLAEQWQVPCVSMGALVRQAIVKGTALGEAVQAARERDGSVPDELLLKLLRKRFEQPDVMLKGWVLSGFPTTLAQAQAFDQLLSSFGLEESAAAYIKASTGILISRLTAAEGNGESITTFRNRITQYKESIIAVMDYYQQVGTEGEKSEARLTVINGSQSVGEVANAIAQVGIEETGAARFIDEAELTVLIDREPLLVVDCVASWCGPCKQVSPLIDRLAETYSDRASVCKLDFDNNRQVAKRFGLKGMPSVMFFKGGELKETLTGAKMYDNYNDVLVSLLSQS